MKSKLNSCYSVSPSMASLLICLPILSLFLLLSISSATQLYNFPPPRSPQSSLNTTVSPEIIQQACKATRFPHQCQTSLTHIPPDPTAFQFVQSAMRVTLDNLNTAQSMVAAILNASIDSHNRTVAAETCLEVLHYSEYRISLTNEALSCGKNKHARAWMSAALAYQYDCWSGLKYVNDTQMVDETMVFLNSLTGLSSNALSIIRSYDVFGNNTASWRPPMTERDGFWESSGSVNGSFDGGFPTNLTANATVCKEGRNGGYKTVQEAVNAAPNNAGARRFVIHIKEGVYEETVRIPLEKKNVVFLGDGIGKTVITGSANVGQPGMTTYKSATVGVLGDGFMAKDLTVENTAGPDAHQAVAFRSDSDMSVIEKCEFLGHQDTLYVHSLRQFYKSCRIQGNVDFIFGSSACVFQDCQILVSPKQLNPQGGENNAVTAHGRTDPSQTTGFVFHNCLINGTEEYMKLYHSNPQVHKNFLGRPWKEFSRTVFINSSLEDLITPDGWMPWTGDFALNTLYYGEFKNSGPGSNMTGRVPWSSKIPIEHLVTYSVQNFIQGDEWIPFPP